EEPGLFRQITNTYVWPTSAGTRTLEAASGMAGASDITLRPSDGQALDDPTFTVVVSQYVHASPTLGDVADADIDEDAEEQVVTLQNITPGSGEEGTQTVTVEAESNMPSVIPTPTITYNGGTTAELRYQPLPNQFTTGGPPVVITVRVRDNE